MKVLIAYICVAKGKRTGEFLSRFRLTYDRFQPGYPHEVVCCCNGGALETDDAVWMRQEWKCYLRKNDPSWDLGAYFDVARNFECDILIACGESVYFNREGWLRRSVEAYEKHGPGFYGFFASNLCNPHLNTSFFMCDPNLLKSQPVPRTREERHNWEHGTNPFWKTVQALGKPVKLVTWDGEYGPGEWRATRGGLWQDDQSNCLAWTIHNDRYRNASEQIKKRWTRNADVGLRA